MAILRLKGRVFSGEGEGTEFVNLPWAKRQVAEKAGFIPFSGTLNVRLSKASVKVRTALTKASGLEISPATGYCRGKLFKASLMGEECAVVLPEVYSYPVDVIEVIAPMNLRGSLHLVDGSMVEVEVTV